MANIMKIAPRTSQNGHKSLLRTLREEKKISQRRLAGKLGIDRNKLARLENRAWQKISLEDLEGLSRGLGMRPEELYFRFNGTERHALTRASESNPIYTFEFRESIKLFSLIRKREDCFIGIIEIPPQKTLAGDEIPQGNLMFGFVMEGKVLMTLPGKEILFGTGECFSMDGRAPYELYTSHQFKPARLMIVTLPAFKY